MAHTDSWTTGAGGFESKPDGAETKRLGDDAIRALKRAIRERMAIGHVFGDATDNTAYDGRHVIDSVSSEFVIYKKDKTSKALIVTENGITLPSGADVYGPGGTRRLLLRKRVIGWTMPGTLFARSQGFNLTSGLLPLEIPGDVMPDGTTPTDITLVEFRVLLMVPPNGANGTDYVSVDMLRCPAGSDPADGNFESILQTPLIVARNAYKAHTSAFAAVTLAEHDILVPSVVATASGTPVSGDLSAGSDLVAELVLAM
jgi:hypothetical protein